MFGKLIFHMFVRFSIIGSYANSGLKFTNKVGLKSFWNTILKSEIISKPVACLEYESYFKILNVDQYI